MRLPIFPVGRVFIIRDGVKVVRPGMFVDVTEIEALPPTPLSEPRTERVCSPGAKSPGSDTVVEILPRLSAWTVESI